MARRPWTLLLPLLLVAVLATNACARNGERATTTGGTPPVNATSPTTAPLGTTSVPATEPSSTSTPNAITTEAPSTDPTTKPTRNTTTTTNKSSSRSDTGSLKVQIVSATRGRSTADIQVTLIPMVPRRSERLEKTNERGEVVFSRAVDRDCEELLRQQDEPGWECSSSQTIVPDLSEKIVVRTDERGVARFPEPDSRQLRISTERVRINDHCQFSGSSELNVWRGETLRVVMKESCS